MTSIALVILLTAASAETSKPVVSVLYFENSTGDASLDVLRKGLADMIITDLVAWDGVTVVERTRLEAVLSELKLQQSKAIDRAPAVKVGKIIRAQYAITGSMFLNKSHEAERAFEALAKKEPTFRLAAMRSAMAKSKQLERQ